MKLTERKDILYGTIIVMDKKKQKTIEKAVFTDGDLQYKGMNIVKIVNFKKVGQTNVNTSYSEVKASNEKRNNITGAYE